MTTTVKIQPASHRVKVTQIHTGQDGRVPTETFLEPGTGERAFYVHSTMEIHVEEVTVEKVEAETKAPIGTAERVVQDLDAYKHGQPTR